MIYSKTSGIALRALAYMASQSPEPLFDVKVMAQACHVSPSYLAKVFQVLSRAGLVSSQRGAGGGYSFLKNPAEMSLLSVIQTTDEAKNSPLSNCVMGLQQCNDKVPCLVHFEWAKLTREIKLKLSRSTIQDLAGLMHHWKKPQRKKRMLSKEIRALFSSQVASHE